jgi:hypothetical protein
VARYFSRKVFTVANSTPRRTQLEIAEDRMDAVQQAMGAAIVEDDSNKFTITQLDCISGIETGRTWDPNIVASNGRVGLFQFTQQDWESTGTTIAWNNGEAARDAGTAALIALALLSKKLGYSGLANPTQAAITEAIDKFGEHDGRYGQAVVDCARALESNDFTRAHSILYQYANWKRGQ